MTNIQFDVTGAASCGNCDWKGDASACDEICDIQERIEPGEVVPCGQCPDCGALCHLDPKPVRLSACCHATIGYDAWVDSENDLCGGPFDNSCCMECGGENPDVADDEAESRDDICSDCGYLLDNGEGFDGKCGACADVAQNERQAANGEGHEYLFDATLLASFRVKAPNEAAARAKLKAHLDCADANFGAWEDTGAPITAEASIDTEGELELSEVDGEAV